MQKTALVTLDYPPASGGVAVYWSNLKKYFNDNELIIIAPRLLPVIEQQEGVIRLPFLFTSMWPRWMRLFLHLPRILRQQKIKQVIVGQILPVGIVVYCLRFVGLIRKMYISCHGMDITQARGHKKILIGWLLRTADQVIVNSKFTQEHVIEYGVAVSNITIVFPCPQVLPLVTATRMRHVLVSVARLVPRKGIDMTLRAYNQVADRLPDIQYHIVGDGPDKQRLIDLCNTELDPSVYSRVVFHGSVSSERLAQLYAQAGVFVLPTRDIAGDQEGFGIVYLEAGLFSLPVIAGNTSGVQEAVVSGVTGIVVDPESVTEIAEAIYTLCTDSIQAARLGAANYVHAQKFLWQTQAARLRTIL